SFRRRSWLGLVRVGLTDRSASPSRSTEGVSDPLRPSVVIYLDTKELHIWTHVNSYLRLEGGGCCLWTPPQFCRPVAGVQLWLHSPMHQGTLTKVPLLAQHAEPEVFIDRERFTPSRFLDGNPTGKPGKVPRRRTVSLLPERSA